MNQNVICQPDYKACEHLKSCKHIYQNVKQYFVYIVVIKHKN